MDTEFLENLLDSLRLALEEENWDRIIEVINELDSKLNGGFDEFLEEDF